MLALGLAGVCAFLNVYATQPLLPLIAGSFGVSNGEAALTVSAPTVAVALASPFVGAIADRFGRRRLIVAALFALVVPTLLAATAANLTALVAWRFIQGLIVPGVYAVAIAYISDAWQGRGVGQAMAALVSGNVIGGFLGRVTAGVAADLGGWRASFVALGLLTAVGAVATWRWLPEETRRGARGPTPRSPRPAGRPMRDPRLLATYAVGFNVLFTLVATFTYVTFHLSAPPFRLGAGALSSIFVVYLVGAFVTPFAGRWIDRVGSRRALTAALAGAIAGGGLTLSHQVWVVMLGLALCCTAAFVSQSASTSYLQVAAPTEVRSAASGIYVCCYYLGGSAGGIVPALAWHLGGWPACVGLVALVQLATIALALRFWRSDGARRATEPPPSKSITGSPARAGAFRPARPRLARAAPTRASRHGSP